ncbi:MAG: hypothetical protein FJ379_13440 [Verrucomicrobia bacterium]|nr:hypothetical protein [Verrucomicrobiota bacterium]
MDPEVRTYLIAAGLVVVAILGLVVVWKVAASFVRLFFWMVLLGLLLVAGGWLLSKQGLMPIPASGSPSVPTSTNRPAGSTSTNRPAAWGPSSLSVA